MNRWSYLAPLGHYRIRILACFRSDAETSPTYFQPSFDVDVFDAFRAYVTHAARVWDAATRDHYRLNLAAANFLLGDLDAAFTIVDAMPTPEQARKYRHALCLFEPVRAVHGCLPLGAGVNDLSQWLAGSPEQGAVRAWLSANRDRLQWLERDGHYVFREG